MFYLSKNPHFKKHAKCTLPSKLQIAINYRVTMYSNGSILNDALDCLSFI